MNVPIASTWVNGAGGENDQGTYRRNRLLAAHGGNVTAQREIVAWQRAPSRAQMPADDGSEDPEFWKFRARLLAAAESGDVDALAAGRHGLTERRTPLLNPRIAV
jgi:hypothetical protein